VCEIIGVFRHEPVEELFQIASCGRIGIFHDDKAAAGVLNKNRDGSVSHSAVVDLRLHLISDFVETFAVGADFDPVVMDAHFQACYSAWQSGQNPPSRKARAFLDHDRALISAPADGLFTLMQGDIERVLFDGPAIHKRLEEMAAQITADYSDRELTVIAILTGSLMFMSDLLRRIPLPLKLDCLSVVSYHGKTQTSGEVIFKQLAVPDVADRDVLILDDILDTGHTLAAVRKKLETAKPRSIRICVLLSKRKQRARDVDADYIGFEIDDEFVVGYGLDFMERYRNLPYIGVLRKELLEQPNQ
jgi:hypoxanthine phosphoribosyltransferase